jgi:hypothetical protein
MLVRLALLLALLPAVAHADKTFTKGSGETWDCAKDAVVTIKTAKATFGLLGNCKRVTVVGGKNAVSVISTAKLVVTGSGNMVDVEQVDAIVVGGARNTVTWKRAGNGDKPKITPGAKSNKVAQGR